MSWSRRVRAIAVAAVLAPLALSGCFRPLNGAMGGKLPDALMAVAIKPISGRTGHYLGNDLIFAFNGTGSTVIPRYRLEIVLHQAVRVPLVDSITGLASAASDNDRADYMLYDMASSKLLVSGNVVNFVTYDRTNQGYGNLSSHNDAEVRNAQVLADQIHTRIAAFFARGG